MGLPVLVDCTILVQLENVASQPVPCDKKL